MKPFVRCLTLAVLLAGGACQPAKAQLFKNLFGRDSKSSHRKPAPAKPKPAPPAAAAPKKASPPKPKPFNYPQTERKTRYRVDVLVQLYLDELVQGTTSVYKVRLPEKAMAGMNFYEGIKLATDTLREYYNLDIYIHDITAAGKRPGQLASSGALDSADLIVGAIPAAQLTEIADFAKRHGVNFISALSPADGGVRENPYFTLLQPTLQTHCEWIAAAVDKKWRSKKPIVIYRPTASVDVNARRYLIGDDSSEYSSLTASSVMVPGTLNGFLETGGPTVLIATIMDAGVGDSLLRVLSRNYPDQSFEVYGMPTWRGIPSLKKADAFPDIAIHYTAPFYFDATTASGQSVAKAYTRAFGGKPGDMVYRGFETLHWYAYLLDRYGTVFNEHTADAGSAGFTRFDVKPRFDRDANLLYNENRHLYLYRYQGGNLSVEQ